MRTAILPTYFWRGTNLGLLLPVVVWLLAACSPVQPTPRTASYDAEVATGWFNLSLKLVKETPGFSPPVASRAFGYLGIALYETVRPGMPHSQTLAGQLNELGPLPQPHPLAPYHWPLAANRALASMTRRLFRTTTSENRAAIDALEAQFARQFQAETSAASFQRSQQWGETVADAIFAWSTTDGGHEGYATNFPTDYVAPRGPGLWVSTPAQFASALQPYWGQNRPFTLATGNECPAAPPLAYSEEPGSAFYAEALEVYEVGRQRTDEQIAVARFWADDPGRTATPPGHWISILTQVLAHEQVSLDVAAEAYAQLGIAVADAFITCWHTKYIYNLVRPITYIQQVIDAEWNANEITDPVTTPPFPEYTSGHSVQSGAAAEVLTALFGEDYAFIDHTHDSLGLAPRMYPSFVAAAEEAAISRLYGGIHYRAAIEQGLAQGRCVAQHVFALRFRK